MLSPDRTETLDELTDIANLWARLFAFSRALQRARIGELNPEPPWLKSARGALAQNNADVEQFFLAAPDITTSVVHPFSKYAAAFRTFSQLATSGSDQSADALIELLTLLMNDIDGACSTIEDGNKKLNGIVAQFGEGHKAMVAAVTAAQLAHEKEHAEITRTAATIAGLEERIAGLSSAMRSSDLAAGKTFIETEVDLLVPFFLGAAESVPFIGIGLTALSIGIDLVETIENSIEIEDALNKLYDALVQQAEEIQAVSAIHSVLQVLTRLNNQYQAAAKRGPRIKVLWHGEWEKLRVLREGLRAGADPSKEPDLTQLNETANRWDELAAITKNMLQLTTAGGPPIVKLKPHPREATP